MKNSSHWFRKIYLKEAEKYFQKFRQEFILDKSNKSYYELISNYFSQDIIFENKFEGNLNKGLLVFGGVGTGKTSSFRILQNVYSLTKDKNHWVKMVNCQRIVTNFNSSINKDEIINHHSRGKFLFDDLGSEPIASNFGKEDIFKRILELRYDEYISRGTKTFITTNFNMEEIRERYGVRVYDRFYEMMNIISLEGKSKR
jgi:DNA replication protein DnaC